LHGPIGLGRDAYPASVVARKRRLDRRAGAAALRRGGRLRLRRHGEPRPPRARRLEGLRSRPVTVHVAASLFVPLASHFGHRSTYPDRMCGRFTLTKRDFQELTTMLGVD